MESLVRFRPRPRVPPPPPPPAAAPSLPAPGVSVLGTIGHRYPAGPMTDFGFNHADIVALDTAVQAAVLRTGDAITGDLTIAGNLGIGLLSPTFPLQVTDGAVTLGFSNDIHAGSGSIGLRLDKVKTNTSPHALDFMVGGVECWGQGMDYDTNNSDNGGTGSADFVVAYDYTAGWNDAGVHALPGGADTLRFTPAEKSSTGKATCWHWSGQAASRNDSGGYWGKMEAGTNLGGIDLSVYGGTGQPHLKLSQRNVANKYCSIDFGVSWLLGQDLGAANTRGFSLFDKVTTSTRTTRLFIEGTDNFAAKVGINTTNVLGILTVRADQGAAGTTVIETLFNGGWSAALANRSINLQQTSDGTNAKQYVMLNGTLAGTAAAPTLTSTGNHSSGFEATDAALSCVVAVGGTAQAIVRPWSTNAQGDIILGAATKNVGFYGTTPVGIQTISGSRGGNSALGDLLTKLALTGLIVDATTA